MFYKIHLILVKREKKYDKNALTDNVKFNEMLAPLYFVLMVLFLDQNYKMNMIQDFFRSSIFYSFVSTLVYVFATNYFQPDLDVKTNRPGMGHFPMGRWFGNFKFGRFIKWFLYPVNRAWYWLWHPYGYVLTHRGAGHWPIWGVWLRVGYLLLWITALNLILNIINPALSISFLQNWLLSFYPWNKNFGNFYFILFCFPIYLSDTVHIAVDYYDAVKRQMSFCPPRIPRGLLMKLINTIRGVR
jgi:uncharacterized metal-binding protein